MKPEEEDKFAAFLKLHVYVSGHYDRDADFERLEKAIQDAASSFDANQVHLGSYLPLRLGADIGRSEVNRLFYVALPPSVYQPVTKGIAQFNMGKG